MLKELLHDKRTGDLLMRFRLHTHSIILGKEHYELFSFWETVGLNQRAYKGLGLQQSVGTGSIQTSRENLQVNRLLHVNFF